MRRLGCVGLLLLLAVLLAALSPVVVATARREMLTAASRDDEGRGRAGAVNSLGTNAPAAAAHGGEDVIGRRKDEVVVRSQSHRRFRTRRIPASQSQVHFGGRIPFTADYHSVHRHPPTHN
ncbi:hypothetical protein GQ55_1G066300 [Panicum hallii var. hallii]|uniref:Uncharacterized protein n=1 Tax=Panicum hallii var. hallii TaxID=1504633 RepID=A0A2T7F2Z1_9POAL|nr:hypothetical protein GQ55_1G066300 [Panicum hallii var. hallii]